MGFSQCIYLAQQQSHPTRPTEYLKFLSGGCNQKKTKRMCKDAYFKVTLKQCAKNLQL